MKPTSAGGRHPARGAANRGRPSPWAWAGLGRASTHALLVILLVIGLTGLATVDVTQRHRQLSRELQELRLEVYQQEEERGRLLLEISTFALADRIEQVAREELRMRLPNPEDIVVVRNAARIEMRNGARNGARNE